MLLAGQSIEEALIWKSVITKISDEKNSDPYLNIQDIDFNKDNSRPSLAKSKSNADSDVSSGAVSPDNSMLKSTPLVDNKRYIKIDEEIIGEVKDQEEEEELIGDGNYIDEPENDKKEISPEFKY